VRFGQPAVHIGIATVVGRQSQNRVPLSNRAAGLAQVSELPVGDLLMLRSGAFLLGGGAQVGGRERGCHGAGGARRIWQSRARICISPPSAPPADGVTGVVRLGSRPSVLS